jgi:hypothetical protein
MSDNISSPTKLRHGTYAGTPGVYWAWKIDGYYDLHHVPEGVTPDGSDVVAELFPTLTEARAWARDMANLEKTGWM